MPVEQELQSAQSFGGGAHPGGEHHGADAGAAERGDQDPQRQAAGHPHRPERVHQRRASAQLCLRGGDGRRFQEQGLRARQCHAGRRPDQPQTPGPAGHGAHLLLARTRAGRRQHGPVLLVGELRRLHAGRDSGAGPGRARSATPSPIRCTRSLSSPTRSARARSARFSTSSRLARRTASRTRSSGRSPSRRIRPA